MDLEKKEDEEMDVDCDTRVELLREPKSALDQYGKLEHTYEEYRGYFKDQENFDLFKMLPGPRDLKEKILRDSQQKALITKTG